MNRPLESTLRTLLILPLLVLATVAGARAACDDTTRFRDGDRPGTLPGWYGLPDGSHALLTWSASDDWLFFDFQDKTFESMTLAPDGSFVLTKEDKSKHAGRVLRDAAGNVTALAFEDEKAGQLRRLAGYGYRQAQASFASGAIPLCATVLIPHGRVRYGVVIAQGSGSSDRNNAWAFFIAHTLADNGIAVLFPDKRGSGQSGGDWHTASIDTLATDTLAGMSTLRGLNVVESRGNLGVVGLSQGGWVAESVAASSSLVDFASAISTAAVSPVDTIEFEVRNDLVAGGVSSADVASAMRAVEAGLNYAVTGRDWAAYLTAAKALPASLAPGFPLDQSDPDVVFQRLLVQFDPMRAIGASRVPLLIQLGGDDKNVPTTQSAVALKPLADRAGSKVQYRTYPGLGHLLMPERSDGTPAFLSDLVAWIDALKPRAA